MKILHINKFNYRRGGAETYMQQVVSAQRGAGHDVEVFATAHEATEPSRFRAEFPRYQELEPPPPGLRSKVTAVPKLLWNTEAARALQGVLADFRPDVVHAHNIYHHLTPSILRTTERAGVPVALTLHDYKLACPSYQFLDKGVPCEACVGGGFRQAALRRCKGGSLAASALLATESSFQAMFNTYEPVGVFVCPSDFMLRKMREARVYPDRLRHVPHPVDTVWEPRTAVAPRLVFAGRLSHEKGVDVLVRAVGELTAAALDGGPVLEVAGEGPEGDRLRSLADEVAPGRVRFHGRLTQREIDALLQDAAALVLPARWYENQPMVVLEALSRGVAVVGTAMGGIPELVRHEVDGLIVRPDDVADLVSALTRVLSDLELSRHWGATGRHRVQQDFTLKAHLDRLDEVYREAATWTGVRS